MKEKLRKVAIIESDAGLLTAVAVYFDLGCKGRQPRKCRVGGGCIATLLIGCSTLPYPRCQNSDRPTDYGESFHVNTLYLFDTN